MNFRNPCKKCLVRACCSITCQEKENFEKHIDSLQGLIMAISVMGAVTIVICLLFLFYQITNSKIDQWLLSSLIWIINFIVFVLLGYMEDIKGDLKGENLLPMVGRSIVLFIMLPIILLFFLLITSCEKIIGSEII